jgi:hypothetical protein
MDRQAYPFTDLRLHRSDLTNVVRACKTIDQCSGEHPQNDAEDLETNEAQPPKAANSSQHLVAAMRLHSGTHFTKAVPRYDSLFEVDCIAQSANSTELNLDLVAVPQE